jgi:hypothetical protein
MAWVGTASCDRHVLSRLPSRVRKLWPAAPCEATDGHPLFKDLPRFHRR